MATFEGTSARETAGDPILVHLRALPPNRDARSPGDICVIVDVSGSMQQDAVVKDLEEGAPVLSVLDIVKHAVKTVVQTLGPEDRLGIVAYSDRASTTLSLTAMDEAGHNAAEAALEKLRANGQTNLWDGLQTGLEMLRASQRPGVIAAMLLLTDGVPNVEPPGGHLGALQSYRAAQGGKLPGLLYTFGFGKELDSKLLDDLAREGGGLYTFIPDAGFVGTTLVNCTANTLTSAARNVELVLEPADGVQIASVEGYGGSCPSGGTCKVALGALQLGQTKDVVVVAKGPGTAGLLLRARLSYDGLEGPVSHEVDVDYPASAGSLPPEMVVQRTRLRLTELVAEALKAAEVPGQGLPHSTVLAEQFLATAKGHNISDPRLTSMVEDVEGQVIEAFSRLDWFQAWGAHYLRSLARAHLAQQCNNFKDPGVQVYGSDLFRSVRDTADDIFVELPPPKKESIDAMETLIALGFPEDQARRALEAAYNSVELAAQYCVEGIPARRPRPPDAGGPHRRAPAALAAEVEPSPAPFSMAAYHNVAGPCFSGRTLVLMADGSQVPISSLQQGDLVQSLEGPAEVRCLVETRCLSGSAALVSLCPHCEATPWHPVFLNQRWVFPAHVRAPELQRCPAVFNLVLCTGHTLRVGDCWTVSLGHGLKGDVVEHRYWGSQRVIEDLERCEGWEAGRVLLSPNCILRGGENNEACGLRQGPFHEDRLPTETSPGSSLAMSHSSKLVRA